LVIAVTSLDPHATVAAETALAKLKLHSGRIRVEVSASISRRKTPELAFAFVPHVPETKAADEPEI
jgi:ribosome-binding factor A